MILLSNDRFLGCRPPHCVVVLSRTRYSSAGGLNLGKHVWSIMCLTWLGVQIGRVGMFRGAHVALLLPSSVFAG